jgi:hypothetical protein
MKDNFLKDKCGFCIELIPETKTVWVVPFESIIQYMVYQKRIDIWHKVKYQELHSSAICTNLTPKLIKYLEVLNS